jgi:hypothetical protein
MIQELMDQVTLLIKTWPEHVFFVLETGIILFELVTPWLTGTPDLTLLCMEFIFKPS